MRHLTRCAAVLSLLSLAALSVAGSGSSGGTPKAPFRFYEGPPKQKEEIAILKSLNFAETAHKARFSLEGPPVRLYSINGKPGPHRWNEEGTVRESYNSGWNAGFYIELPPGAYTLTVGYFRVTILGRGSARSVSDQTVSFTAEAGHEYLLNAETFSSGQRNYKWEGRTWRPTLDDETAGTRIYPHSGEPTK